MDEWHQLQAVRTTFKYGTPNIAGSANGTMFHFLLSGFYLIPFTIFHYIDPSVLKIDDSFMREKIFLLLRWNSIIWGVGSLIILNQIAILLRISKKIVLSLFCITPLWLCLSGYFKYDISLMFWMLLSLFFILKYTLNPNSRNFILAGLLVGFSISIKISSFPLGLILFISYIFFEKKRISNLKYLCVGLLVALIIILLFGIPDTLFGRGNLYNYFYLNIVSLPQDISNFHLNMDPTLYLVTKHYSIIFGHGLYFLSFIAFIFWIIYFIKFFLTKKIHNVKKEVFIFLIFLILFTSLLSLKLDGGGNRSLVLLPLLSILIALMYKKINTNQIVKNCLNMIIGIVVIIQLYESFQWIQLKIISIPQIQASAWITKNIKPNSTIGIENIPIYQNLPDVIQQEFYYQQLNVKKNTLYKYIIVDYKLKQLPSIILLTNAKYELVALRDSPKIKLIQRLKNEKYKTIELADPYSSVHIPFLSPTDYYFSWMVPSPSMTLYIK